MPNYVKLTSEKYLADSVEKEIRRDRAERNQRAVKSFTTMAVALAVFAITFYVALNFSSWTEIVKTWF